MIIAVVAVALLIIVYLFLSITIVPQSENFLVERLGRYHRTLGPGLQLIIPVIETVRHKIDILERQLPTEEIPAITSDNVSIELGLAILYRVSDASRSVYRIKNVDQAILTSVTGVVRSVLGKTDLDGVQSNRQNISESIETDLKNATDEWGIVLTRVEVTDVRVDDETKQAMQLQLNAERSRRAIVQTAEGNRAAAQLQSDADLYAAQKKADARRILADADAYALSVVANAIQAGGESAVNFEIKKLQAEAMRSIGSQESAKLVLIPADIVATFSSIVTSIVKR